MRRLPKASVFISKSGPHAIEKIVDLKDLLGRAEINVFFENQWRVPFPDLPWNEFTLPRLDEDGLELLAWIERLFENTDLLYAYQAEWKRKIKDSRSEEEARRDYEPWSQLGKTNFQNSLLSPWSSYIQWCHHLFLFSNSDVVLALLTGEERDRDGKVDLSDGMEFELLTAVCHGIPVIWIGITPAGCEIALAQDRITRVHHPSGVSHFLDWTQEWSVDEEEFLQLCANLISVPKPDLPQVFESGVPIHFRHVISVATPDGWERADLSTVSAEPKAEVHYGPHVCDYRLTPRVASPPHREDIPLRITDAENGVIEGDLVLTRQGMGRIRVVWDARHKDDPNHPTPVGTLILDWDFVCGMDPHLTTVGFACGLTVTSLPAFLKMAEPYSLSIVPRKPPR